MAEPLISTGAALVGAGAWFANRVFGPSAGALGDSLKVYLQSQLPKIFDRAGDIAKSENLELSEISPGLLTRMIIDASSSDDSDEIREWWANLFVAAAVEPDNIHATLSDMMALVGPAEAAALKGFYERVEAARPDENGPWKVSRFSVEHYVNEFMQIDIGYQFPIDSSDFERVSLSIESFRKNMPALPIAWSIPVQVKVQINNTGPIDFVMSKGGKVHWFDEDQLAYDVLERARIIHISRHPLSRSEGRPGWVEFVEFSQLGMAFYEACVGITRKCGRKS